MSAEIKAGTVCYFVMQTQVAENGEYRALIAKEGEQGYFRTDWTWGKDFAQAEAIAEARNNRLGIDKGTAFKIVAHSMRSTAMPVADRE